MIVADEILFLGWSTTPICWYRAAMPAMHIGADWVGIMRGDHIENIVRECGLVRNQSILPNLQDYRLVIIQQPFERAWLQRIPAMQEHGIKVLFEIDDYIHNIPKIKDHDFRFDYTRQHLKAYELGMRLCDGIICSTEYLARRYRRFNPNVYVCRNGIDTARYDLTRPKRDWTAIGWAGATGHTIALVNWLNNAVLPVMRDYDDTRFVSVGVPSIADTVGDIVGPERVLGTPFTMIENYPAAMCHMDIALAPAGQSAWYASKSQLRWLEASALGIPVIASPHVYQDIEDGVTGFHASTPVQVKAVLVELLDDPKYCAEVGAYARQHVRRYCDMKVMAQQWLEVAERVVP